MVVRDADRVGPGDQIPLSRQGLQGGGIYGPQARCPRAALHVEACGGWLRGSLLHRGQPALRAPLSMTRGGIAGFLGGTPGARFRFCGALRLLVLSPINRPIIKSGRLRWVQRHESTCTRTLFCKLSALSGVQYRCVSALRDLPQVKFPIQIAIQYHFIVVPGVWRRLYVSWWLFPPLFTLPNCSLADCGSTHSSQPPPRVPQSEFFSHI